MRAAAALPLPAAFRVSLSALSDCPPSMGWELGGSGREGRKEGESSRLEERLGKVTLLPESGEKERERMSKNAVPSLLTTPSLPTRAAVSD